MRKYRNLLLERENATAILWINRPDVLNALNLETQKELSSAIESLRNDSQVRCVILAGSGGKAFCAGGDIKELKTLTKKSGLTRAKLGQKITLQMESLPVPVIAAIHGYALGGGCELAMACDFRIASPAAKFGQPEVNIGLIAGFGGTQRLPRLVGKGKALAMLLTGDLIDAQEAHRIGLVEELVPENQLMARAKEIAAKIAERAPLAVAYSKKVVVEGLNKPLAESLKLEASYFSRVCGTKDKGEGTSAFLEKRQPNFNGK